MNENMNTKMEISDQYILQQIGNYVRHSRQQKQLTQKELAQQAGISRSTLSLIERGEAATTLTLIQILRILNQLQVFDAFKVIEEVSPLDLLNKSKPKRQRVRKTKRNNEANDLEW
jgi:transcriptional regulator with XRE-family HTH domain